jgi:hypothetical protein
MNFQVAGRQLLLFFQKAFASWILCFPTRVSGLIRSFFDEIAVKSRKFRSPGFLGEISGRNGINPVCSNVYEAPGQFNYCLRKFVPGYDSLSAVMVCSPSHSRSPSPFICRNQYCFCQIILAGRAAILI